MSAEFLTGQDSLAGVASENDRLQRRMVFLYRVGVSATLSALAILCLLGYLATKNDLTAPTPQQGLLMGAGFASLLVSGSAYLRRRSARLSQAALGHWTGYLRSRRLFYDRLALECEKANAYDAPFSVLFIRLRGPARGAAASVQVVERALALVESGGRRDDVAGAIGPSEIAVLSLRIRGHETPWLAERLKTAAASAVYRDGVEVRIGWAAYSEKARTPDALIERALATLDQREAAGRFARAA